MEETDSVKETGWLEASVNQDMLWQLQQWG